MFGFYGLSLFPVNSGDEGTFPVPTLTASSPANGSTGATHIQPIEFTVHADSGIDQSTLKVWLNGSLVVTNDLFEAGYAGGVALNEESRVLDVLISTHPAFLKPEAVVVIEVADLAGTFVFLSFWFGVYVSEIKNLRAKSWCEGKRIDLAWDNPADATRLLIRRSANSFCRFIDDPGETVYEGALITQFVDGVYDNSETGIQTSNKALIENKFYYYSIFYTFSGGSPYEWLHSFTGDVSGLSIRDYFAMHGHYVYQLLPSGLRLRDSDPSRGADRYKVRDFCDLLQCSVNLQRGWAEGLNLINDPDETPAGLHGVAENQTGILQAVSWGMGVTPENSYDAGVLRRVAVGMMLVNAEKGTCPSLVDLTALFTEWSSRCDQIIDPVCSIQRVAQTFDGESSLQRYVASANADNANVATAGQLTLYSSRIFKVDGATVQPLASEAPYAGCVIDALGTFACVASVAAPSGGQQVVTLSDAAAKLRSEIVVAGTGASGSFTITYISTGSYPWQFPSAGGHTEPVFGANAFAGLKLMDSNGDVFPITASAATNGSGDTVLTVTGSPATGSCSIAYDFDETAGPTYASRVPLFKATFVNGEITLAYDALWDIRLNDETQIGPWSLITGVGSPTVEKFAASPSDSVIWVTGNYELLDEATGVGENWLQDSTKTWTTGQWYGYYLLPNWNQTRLFKIIGNTADKLIVSAPEGGLDTLSVTNSRYVILDEKSALKYERLAKLVNSFVPIDTNVFIKFED